jgi:hypothetical protein
MRFGEPKAHEVSFTVAAQKHGRGSVRRAAPSGWWCALARAAQRVGRPAMAYSFREATFAEVIVGVDPDPANKEKITTWCKDYWAALHPYSAGGAYVNFMMEEGQDRVQATYRDNYQRLAAIKKKYAPQNFFRVNQNIRPAE